MRVQGLIEQKLTFHLAPQVLQVTNESSMHSVPAGSETHFKVVVVSDAFEGKSPVERHRLVYDLLQEELRGGVHALTLTSRTSREWERSAAVAQSPACLGGSKAK